MVTFGDFDVAPGGFLDATQPRPLVKFQEPPDNPPAQSSQWSATSAQTAYLLFQLPARAAFLSKWMIPDG